MLYLLILVSLFVLLNGVGSQRLEKKLMLQKKDLLMQEAQMIARLIIILYYMSESC